MTRTVIGLSFSLVMVLGSAVACGSKSTDDSNSGAGNGSVLGGGTGGTASNGAGTSNGGTRTGGGTGGTTSTGGLCADQTVTCVDATTAKGCNLDTGVIENFSCVDELQALGVVSKGCTMDPTGDYCSLDALTDKACADGAKAVAYCENATAEQQFNVYVNCFKNNQDAHTIVTCFSKYVTPTMKTAGNCAMADAACLGGVVGAGGAGAGGAGAGGDPTM